MDLFIDTANLSHIEELVAYNIISGVTTNPSLMAKEGISGKENCHQHYIDICNLVNGPVSAEVISTDCLGMLKEADELSALHPNIVIKIPMIKEGIKAIYQLNKKGIKCAGIDKSAAMVKKAHELFPNYTFKHNDVMKTMSVNRNSVSLITCLYFTLYYIKLFSSSFY